MDDLFEVNEAFAAIVLAWSASWSRPGPGQRQRRRHRPRPPAGRLGARLITTLLHELERDEKEFGLVTMWCGGGFGTATLIQRIG